MKKLFKYFFFLLLAAGCSGGGNSNPLLTGECSVAETYMESLLTARKKKRESSNEENLQARLDSQREMDRIAELINRELKKCSGNFPAGRTVPFSGPDADSGFLVEEVRLAGCRLNYDYSDIETSFIARIKILKSGQTGFNASLIDEAGKKLAGIVFLFTNDFPVENKTLLILAHSTGFDKIKKFSKVVFQ